MNENKYLRWLAGTDSAWWNDSADIAEVENAMQNGAVGVTTNPILISQVLNGNRALLNGYKDEISAISDSNRKAEKIIEIITKDIAGRFLSIYEQTEGENGYVCAQVNPKYPGDADYMFENALRLASWAPNISVKIPVTAAGLEVVEECVARGINVTATVSFTVPQVLAVEEAYQKGLKRAEAGGSPRLCNAVIMVGRLDDYLRDAAHDGRKIIDESSIVKAGTAAMKRAYNFFVKKGTMVKLMPAGMRGVYHTAELAGADIRYSIHPKIQGAIMREEPETLERMDEPVPQNAIDELMTIREFVRAYEPDGMKTEEFIAYGVTQKTLAQFVDAWNIIESFSF